MNHTEHDCCDFFALVPSDIFDTLNTKGHLVTACSCATACDGKSFGLQYFIPVEHEHADLTKYPMYSKEGMDQYIAEHVVKQAENKNKIKSCSLGFYGTTCERR